VPCERSAKWCVVQSILVVCEVVSEVGITCIAWCVGVLGARCRLCV
jgi:hypothetical protein